MQEPNSIELPDSEPEFNSLEHCLQDSIRELCSAWARHLDARCQSRAPHALRQIHARDGSPIKPAGDVAFLMAQLDFPLWSIGFINYRAPGTSKDKTAQVIALGLELSRRQYWIDLDRVHFFVRGWLVARLANGEKS